MRTNNPQKLSDFPGLFLDYLFKDTGEQRVNGNNSFGRDTSYFLR